MNRKSTQTQKKGQESFLIPISVVGVVVPGAAVDSAGPEFKLATLGGAEYSILTDAEWDRVLESYRWEQVRLKGLLNCSTMAILPQWVIPHGPTGETQRVGDAPFGKGLDFVSRIKKTVADLILVPAYA